MNESINAYIVLLLNKSINCSYIDADVFDCKFQLRLKLCIHKISKKRTRSTYTTEELKENITDRKGR